MLQIHGLIQPDKKKKTSSSSSDAAAAGGGASAGLDALVAPLLSGMVQTVRPEEQLGNMGGDAAATAAAGGGAGGGTKYLLEDAREIKKKLKKLDCFLSNQLQWKYTYTSDKRITETRVIV